MQLHIIVDNIPSTRVVTTNKSEQEEQDLGIVLRLFFLHCCRQQRYFRLSNEQHALTLTDPQNSVKNMMIICMIRLLHFRSLPYLHTKLRLSERLTDQG